MLDVLVVTGIRKTTGIDKYIKNDFILENWKNLIDIQPKHSFEIITQTKNNDIYFNLHSYYNMLFLKTEKTHDHDVQIYF